MSHIDSAIAAGLGYLAIKAMPQGDEPEDHPDNTFGLPDGRPIIRELVKWLKLHEDDILKKLPAVGRTLPGIIHGIGGIAAMAHAFTPIISAYWAEGGRRTRVKLGLDPDHWKVVDSHTQEMIGRAAFNFCDSTNNTTTLRLNKALDELRREMTRGIVKEGEAIPALRKRIQTVFTGLTKEHATLIARTEASRAVHAASKMSAKESGVVSTKKWKAAANSCDWCKDKEAETEANPIPLDELFGVVGNHADYANIDMCPGHPLCRCSVVYELTETYREILETTGPPAGDLEPGPMGPDPFEIAVLDLVKHPHRVVLPALSLYHGGRSLSRLFRAFEPLPKKPKLALPPLTPEPHGPRPSIADLLAGYHEGDAKVTLLANLDTAYREAKKQMDDSIASATAIVNKIKNSTGEVDPKDLAAAEAKLARCDQMSAAYKQKMSTIPGMVASIVKNRNTGTIPIISKWRENHPAATEILVGHTFISSVLSANSDVPKGIKVDFARLRGKGQRNYYDPATRKCWIADDSEAPDVAHEIAHAIEYQVPGVRDLTREFLDYRVGDEPAVPLHKLPWFLGVDVDKWEKGRKDRFEAALGIVKAYYAGKDYKVAAGNLYGTEILSLGIEELLTDPVAFARNDPEYCKFVVGILDGSLVEAAKKAKEATEPKPEPVAEKPKKPKKPRAKKPKPEPEPEQPTSEPKPVPASEGRFPPAFNRDQESKPQPTPTSKPRKPRKPAEPKPGPISAPVPKDGKPPKRKDGLGRRRKRKLGPIAGPKPKPKTDSEKDSEE